MADFAVLIDKQATGYNVNVVANDKKAELPQRWPRDAPYMGAL